MRVFEKKELKQEIKSLLKYIKKEDLDGNIFRMKDLIGDYQYDYRIRVIKEALFESAGSFGGYGAQWFLRYPKAKPGKLVKKVMKFKLNG